jgi:hypothetical protein
MTVEKRRIISIEPETAPDQRPSAQQDSDIPTASDTFEITPSHTSPQQLRSHYRSRFRSVPLRSESGDTTDDKSTQREIKIKTPVPSLRPTEPPEQPATCRPPQYNNGSLKIMPSQGITFDRRTGTYIDPSTINGKPREVMFPEFDGTIVPNSSPHHVTERELLASKKRGMFVLACQVNHTESQHPESSIQTAPHCPVGRVRKSEHPEKLYKPKHEEDTIPPPPGRKK